MIKRITNTSLKLFTKLFRAEKPLLLTGVDSSNQLASLLRASGHTRPLVVTGKSLLQRGQLDEVLERLRSEGCEVTVFDGILPNPTYDVIENGIRKAKENRCDSVFCVGGGSAIDAAKVIAACVSNGVSVHQILGLLKVKKPTLPFYVVPTTSGTGSEVTSAAVISDPVTHQKRFVVDAKLVPTAAALDANMLKSLPPHITASTGMDALTHAIEAYTSLNRFADAERDAKLAIKLLLDQLPLAYADGNNVKAREEVALASFLSGHAFNKSGLGYVHAISHQLSAHYNTPHGLANAVILPHVMRFNKPVSSSRLAELERLVSGNTGADDVLAERFISRVESLGKQLGLPSALGAVQEEDFDAIAKNALKEARWFYAVPKRMTSRHCKAILAGITSPTTVESRDPQMNETREMREASDHIHVAV